MALASRRARCSPRSTCRGTRRHTRRRLRWSRRRRRRSTRPRRGSRWPRRSETPRRPRSRWRKPIWTGSSRGECSPRSSTRGSTRLVAEHAADAKLADEQKSDLAAAVAAERTGSAEILNAKAKLLAAEAAVDQAKADAAEARANLGVAEARLDRAKVNLDYAKIVAPFDGVVTHRTFHLGALIRSATEGGQQPLLTVKRTDKMRVVVLVPDGDVVLTKLGDTAVVSVDALDGRSFTGTLARIARAEDAERMMRVEIDLPNPEDVLCDGMYGKALITLEQDAKSLAVPAACVVEHSGRSGGVVFVVRDGIARRTEVKLGGDNGSQAEIRSGIRPGRFRRASLRNAAGGRDARRPSPMRTYPDPRDGGSPHDSASSVCIVRAGEQLDRWTA